MMKIVLSMLAAVLMQRPVVPIAGIPRVQIKETLRIGSVDRQNYALTWIGGIATAPDGTIFVSQPLDPSVIVYDERGGYVRRIGKKGSGPGEFRAVDRISWSPAGLAVLDLALNRLTLFNKDGKVVRTLPKVDHFWGPAYLAEAPWVLMDNGFMITKPDVLTSDLTPTFTVPLSLLDVSGKYMKDLAAITIGNKFRPMTTTRGARSNVHLPNGSFTLFELLPAENSVMTIERQASDNESTFTVRKIRTDGALLVEKSFSAPSIRVTGSEIRKEAERTGEALAKNAPKIVTPPEAIDMYERAWADMKYQAPVDEIATGRDGSVWLRRGAFGKADAEWLGFDRSAKPIGRVQLQISTRVLCVSRSFLWAAEIDEDDVPFVVRYSIIGRGS